VLPTAKQVALIAVDEPPWFRSEAPSAVAAAASGAARRGAGRRDRQQSHGAYGRCGAKHAFANSAAQPQNGEIEILLVREREERDAQDDGFEEGEQREYGAQAHGGRVLGDACELGSGIGAGGCLSEEDHAGDSRGDICQEREPGEACVRRASHGFSPEARTGLRLGRTYDGQGPRVPRSLLSSVLERLTEHEAQLAKLRPENTGPVAKSPEQPLINRRLTAGVMAFHPLRRLTVVKSPYRSLITGFDS